MVSLMLNPRFKTFHLVCSLVGCEQGKAIVAKYDKLKKNSYVSLVSLSFASFGRI
jgi:hypothetical protein